LLLLFDYNQQIHQHTKMADFDAIYEEVYEEQEQEQEQNARLLLHDPIIIRGIGNMTM
jgi:hypothetical protein